MLMLSIASMAKARLAFFAKLRQRTLAKPHRRFKVRNGCSTFDRTLDLNRLVSLSASARERTIAVVEFRFYTEVKGRFTHLLPVKEGDEPPTILH